jgi:hypothetical protein
MDSRKSGPFCALKSPACTQFQSQWTFHDAAIRKLSWLWHNFATKFLHKIILYVLLRIQHDYVSVFYLDVIASSAFVVIIAELDR